ncbi:MAG TPA: lamin tail domain-containing protein [Gaiellaceae bacterium]|nr:lamin tail domain-containing protein [Gaiellaceae bacterium]
MRHRHLLLVPLVIALLCASSAAHAGGGSTSLVVAQLYASGGNSGATYANDYVELFNRGTSSVDLSGWTLQYASAASTSWSPTALSGTIAPGRAYLVQLASGGTNGGALPAADATGTTNLAATGGKVAVVDDTTALSCGATAGSCSTAAGIADFVGYGGAADYEGGAAAPAPDATSAIARAAGGCTDTDSNTDDFATTAPAPVNSSAAAAPCSGGGGSSSFSASASVRVQVQPVIAIALGQPTLDFGALAAGATAPLVNESVTVTSNDAAGYTLTAHRSAFTPRDLPLGLAANAPSGGTLGAGISPTVLAALPIAPAPDLTIGSTSAAAPGSGDLWATKIGFTTPLPSVPAGQYTATVTYTVVPR